MMPFVPETPPPESRKRVRASTLQEENEKLRNQLMLQQTMLNVIAKMQDDNNKILFEQMHTMTAQLQKMQESMLLAFGDMVGKSGKMAHAMDSFDPPVVGLNTESFTFHGSTGSIMLSEVEPLSDWA